MFCCVLTSHHTMPEKHLTNMDTSYETCRASTAWSIFKAPLCTSSKNNQYLCKNRRTLTLAACGCQEKYIGLQLPATEPQTDYTLLWEPSAVGGATPGQVTYMFVSFSVHTAKQSWGSKQKQNGFYTDSIQMFSINSESVSKEGPKKWIPIPNSWMDFLGKYNSHDLLKKSL